ncbi:TadE family protein [Microlunatus flavus]|uniref:Flp pilus assembly protein TadG n=1 Tax=Microlunatus flavus TaxID=1036181 RepID=A0A1H9B372_9ACTN|nr:TadE family protein [Microlunatus flavus]SEP83482.1 Flp pilus assembly protein TadG [Microlunatus flavus]
MRTRTDRRAGRPGRRGETGSVAVEVALLAPALVLVIGLLVAGGRLWFARTTVVEAAQSSARAASLARGAAQAGVVGAEASRQSMSTAGLRCGGSSVRVSTTAFSVPVGTPATVTSDVSCDVAFADVFLPGMPGSIHLTGRGQAALDTYRAR